MTSPSDSPPWKLRAELPQTAPLLLPGVVHASVVVHQIISPFFAQNAFVLLHPASGSAIALDPGFGSTESIRNCVRDHGCQLRYILLTHEHIDHIGDLNDLRAEARCPVVASVAASRNITDAKRNLSLFHLNKAYVYKRADIEHAHGKVTLPWPGPKLQVVTAQGHTDGGVMFELEEILFTGDTIIKGERTVVKLPTGDRTKLAETLARVFSDRSPTTTCYPGHGVPFQLQDSHPDFHLPPRDRHGRPHREPS